MAEQSESQAFIEKLYQTAKQEGEDPEDVAERVYQNARGVSRREAMQAGGALGVGALLGGGGGLALTQRAAADASTSDSDGNVGLPGDRVDVFADGVDATTVSTEGAVIGPYKWAAAYDGGDPDARLDAAISDAANGETVFLEAATYDATRTVSKILTMIGSGIEGTEITANWTITTNLSSLRSVRVTSTITVDLNGFLGTDLWLDGGSISAEGNSITVTESRDGSVTFASGTTGGMVDSCYSGLTATDNGSNVIGDIA